MPLTDRRDALQGLVSRCEKRKSWNTLEKKNVFQRVHRDKNDDREPGSIRRTKKRTVSQKRLSKNSLTNTLKKNEFLMHHLSNPSKDKNDEKSKKCFKNSLNSFHKYVKKARFYATNSITFRIQRDKSDEIENRGREYP